MRRLMPWLGGLLVLVLGVLGVLGLALVAVSAGPVAAFCVALGGYGIVLALLDHPANRHRSS